MVRSTLTAERLGQIEDNHIGDDGTPHVVVYQRDQMVA
jgi:hypothetical protein